MTSRYRNLSREQGKANGLCLSTLKVTKSHSTMPPQATAQSKCPEAYPESESTGLQGYRPTPYKVFSIQNRSSPFTFIRLLLLILCSAFVTMADILLRSLALPSVLGVLYYLQHSHDSRASTSHTRGVQKSRVKSSP